MTSLELYRQKEKGLTLVELMVALALSTIIAIAAISSLIVSRQGFVAVDATSQLRDNSRFAADIIQRLAVQSGYQAVAFAAATRANTYTVKGANTNPEPNITGADNALVKASQLPDITSAYISRVGASTSVSKCSSSTDTTCANGSDVLIIRYQSSEGIEGSGIADGTMINCAGIPETTVPIDGNDRIISIFHVAKSSTGSEPSLMCSFLGAGGVWTTRPIVEGVESFQVLYGVDGFTTGVNTQFTGPQDTVPDRYLKASEMIVANVPDSVATYSNWRRVRSLRIGMVLRGPLNSKQAKDTNLAKYCPLGVVDPTATTTCVDESGSETPPMGAEFPRKGAVIADDGRLRQVLTFTVYLRNVQTQ